MSARRALFIGVRGFGLAHSRLPLVRALRERGWRVTAIANRDPHAAALEDAGAEFIDAGFGAAAVAPLQDLRAAGRLRRQIGAQRPALLHVFNAKPTLLTLLALQNLRFDGVLVCTVTGLGHAFVHNRLVRGAATLLYRRLLSAAQAVVFQNPDDLEFFVRRGLVERRRARLVAGAGVDTGVYRPAVRRSDPEAVTVLMAARLLRSKGVLDYLEAARMARTVRPELRLLLAAEAAPGHPDAIDESELRARAADAGVEYLGYRPDLPALLAQADLLVHPSYYREGVPRVLLEAAASGVAAITTDVPGCREAIQDGATGLLVPPRNPARLARAIETLAADRARRDAMGRAARRLAEERFDIHAITAAQLEIYEELLARVPER